MESFELGAGCGCARDFSELRQRHCLGSAEKGKFGHRISLSNSSGIFGSEDRGKSIAVVKVDSGTVYWNGKTDKAASRKDLTTGDELATEVVEKKGLPVAQKVRFLHRS